MNHKTIDIERLRGEAALSLVEHHDTITSTNDRARELAAHLQPGEMALVLADRQTAGRGRGANRWWTGAGSLAFSLLLHPAARGIRRENFPLISLAAALAIIDAQHPVASAGELGLHWPNDVFAQGAELAGVLVEALTDGWHVLGVGLNVNNRTIDAPAELREDNFAS